MVDSMKRAAMVMAVAVLVAACGSGAATSSPRASAAPSAAPATQAPSMAPLTGSVIVSGSSTVEPISALVAEFFNEQISSDVAIEVTGPGTSDGFERFCAGETDISDASRSIRQSEIDACTAAGIQIIELKVAIDGLSIITAAANTSVTCLTFADLYALIGPE